MRRRRSRFKRGCVVRRRIFRRVPVRRVIRALLAASLLLAAFFGTRARASGQTAGTAKPPLDAADGRAPGPPAASPAWRSTRSRST